MADFLLKVCKDCFDIFPLLTWHCHILFYISFFTYSALSLAQTKQYHKACLTWHIVLKLQKQKAVHCPVLLGIPALSFQVANPWLVRQWAIAG